MNEFEAFIFCLSIRMMIVNKRNGYIELKIQAIVFFEWFLNNRMVVDEFAKNVYYKKSIKLHEFWFDEKYHRCHQLMLFG